MEKKVAIHKPVPIFKRRRILPRLDRTLSKDLFWMVVAVFCLLGSGRLSRANVITQPPPAQNVLLLDTGNIQMNQYLPNALACAGASVTVLQVGACDGLTAALSGAGLTLAQFDQVWDVRWTGSTGACAADSITANDATLFQNYLDGGGSLFLLS